MHQGSPQVSNNLGALPETHRNHKRLGLVLPTLNHMAGKRETEEGHENDTRGQIWCIAQAGAVRGATRPDSSTLRCHLEDLEDELSKQCIQFEWQR